MLIGRTIAILYFLARKITAESAEERRVFNRLFPLRVPLRTLRLNFRFGYSIPHVPSSSCIVKSTDSGFRYLSSYRCRSVNPVFREVFHKKSSENPYTEHPTVGMRKHLRRHRFVWLRPSLPPPPTSIIMFTASKGGNGSGGVITS